MISVRHAADGFDFTENYASLFEGVEETATVLDLKVRVAHRRSESYNVGSMRLLYKGRSLRDEELLYESLQITSKQAKSSIVDTTSNEKDTRKAQDHIILYMRLIAQNGNSKTSSPNLYNGISPHNISINSGSSKCASPLWGGPVPTAIVSPPTMHHMSHIHSLDDKSMAAAGEWVKQQATLEASSSRLEGARDTAAGTGGISNSGRQTVPIGSNTSMSAQDKYNYESVAAEMSQLLQLRPLRESSPHQGNIYITERRYLLQGVLNAAGGPGENNDIPPGAGQAQDQAVAGGDVAAAAAEDPPIVWFQGQVLLRIMLIGVILCHDGSAIEYCVFILVALFIYFRESGILRKLMRHANTLRQYSTISTIYNTVSNLYNEGFPVPQTGGILLDIFSIIYSFYASLFPLWDPRPVTPIVRIQLDQGAVANNNE